MARDPLTEALNVQSPELEEVDLVPTIHDALSEVLQVVILRDGLLIGTEVFVPGGVTVGSAGDLALEGLAPRHLKLTLRAGKVTVAADGGDVYVNGNPISVTPVRPVDDVAVGPYALKLRVIGKRAPAQKAAPLKPVRVRGSDGPTVVIAPAPVKVAATQRLFLELAWGDQRLDARAFGRLPAQKPLVAAADDRAAMPLWGFGLDGPMVLAAEHGDGYRVFVPPAAAVERRGADGDFQPVRAAGHVDLKWGEAARFTSEHTALIARVGPVEAAPFVNPLRGAPLLAFGLTALLLAAFGAFASLAPTEDEADFALKAMPRIEVKAYFPLPPKPKPPELASRDDAAGKPPEPAGPRRRDDDRPPKNPRQRHVLPFGGQRIAELIGGKLPDVKFPGGPKRIAAHRFFPNIKDGVRGPPAPGIGLDLSGGTMGLNGLLKREGRMIGELGARDFGSAGVAAQVGEPRERRGGGAPTGPGIDKNAVRKVIDAHVHVISSCYERAMIAEKDASGGKVTLEWGISTAGQVTFVRTKHSSMKTAAVERCIMSALKTWDFPRATRAGVIVTYPFLFNSVGYQ